MAFSFSFSRAASARIACWILGAVALVLCVAAPSPAAAAPLSIAVSGNHFVNGAGQTIRLLGVNHQSAEYGCVDGFGYNDEHFDDADAAAIAGWNANAVRVPLNEDCWLGINGQPNSNQGATPPLTVAGYRASVEDYVAALHAHGLYAILDLHWTAPGSQVALEQQPMPDTDHSVAFWTSVASTFQGDPAVVFDVFNEPWSPTDPRSGSETNPARGVSWSCWLSGGCYTDAYNENGTVTGSYQVAGMQSLITTIRSTGATQPLLVGGLDYANDLSGWLANRPTDPLGQLAASFHDYMGKACSAVACWNSQVAPVAASVPVVTGEFDEDDYLQANCATKSPSTFDSDWMAWADTNGVSYLAWGWIVESASEQNSDGCSAFVLISDYAGTPAAPNGTTVHSHLLSLPAGGVTATAGGSSPTSPVPTAGTGATPTGAVPVTTTTAVQMSKPPTLFTLVKVAVARGGVSVALTMRAPSESSGVASARTIKAFRATAKARKATRMTVGSIRVSVRAAKPATVVLRLSKVGAKLLATNHTLRVQLTITLTSAGHTPTVLDRTITVTALRHPVSSR